MEKEKQDLIELMTIHGNYLKETAFYLTNDLHLAEDLTQDTFISFYKSRQFLGKSSPKTYLYRILMNHIKMYKRKNKNILMAFDEYESKEYISIENDAINKLDVGRALAKLKPKYQEVMVFYYINDLSVEEISKVLGVGISTSKMRLKRGREQVKEILGGSYETICGLY